MESVISKELIEKYEVQDLNVLCDVSGETLGQIIHYEDFLNKTDHIPNKIIESQVLGESPEDYTEILNYRQLARDEINRLSNVE